MTGSTILHKDLGASHSHKALEVLLKIFLVQDRVHLIVRKDHQLPQLAVTHAAPSHELLWVLDSGTAEISQEPVLTLKVPDPLVEPTPKNLNVALIAPGDSVEPLGTPVLVFVGPLSLKISEKRFLVVTQGLVQSWQKKSRAAES